MTASISQNTIYANWLSHEKTGVVKNTQPYGAVFVRRGGKHDVYLQPATNIETTVPRHDEIKKFTAKNIIKILSNFEDK
jgi:predicted RNA binding protein YcfA (HicA-like mRNA interferase family)